MKPEGTRGLRVITIFLPLFFPLLHFIYEPGLFIL